jgi:hypothetical protein
MKLDKIVEILNKDYGFDFSNQTDVDDIGGNLNHIFVLEGDINYVLRIPRQSEHSIQMKQIVTDYLDGLYSHSLFGGYEESFFYRNLAEQSEYAKTCLEREIHVPEIFVEHNDFLLMQFIEGELYKDSIKQKTEPISWFLNALRFAHGQGIVIGDRWGGNTIVMENSVYFLDFDIRYIDDILEDEEERLQFEKSKDFDLAVGIYGTIHYCERKSEAVEIIHKFLIENDDFYNIENLRIFLKGYISFHSKSYWQENDKPFDPVDSYEKTNQYIQKLIDIFATQEETLVIKLCETI